MAGATCYLCGKVIGGADGESNRDHVPPKRVFAKAVRQQYGPNLPTLPTHRWCNSAAERDEAYFIVSFAGHVNTDVAQAVVRDIAEKAQRGEGVGLIRDVINRFGKVTGPDGQVLFSYDTNRVNRLLWKVVRGIYMLEQGGALPAQPPSGIELINPQNTPEHLQAIPWFRYVRDTAPMGRYGRVFDYKWLGWKDGDLRGHAVALNFWDGLLATVLFHDPACECGQCAAWQAGQPEADESTTGTIGGDILRDASDDANTQSA
jgi:hypothetical protein